MHVVHLYDGHEQVHKGRGSVPNVVWNIARETAAAGHEVTVLERQWDGLSTTATHEGVSFERLSLRTGADEPWTRVPYERVGSKTGLARLVTDRTNFALQALRRLHNLEYDIVHVHLPFAANVLATVAPWLRNRLVFTAHLGELRLNLLTEDSPADVALSEHPDTTVAATDGGIQSEVSTPGILSMFSPDVHLAKRTARTTVLNPSIERAFEAQGVASEQLETIPNGVDVDRFQRVSDSTVTVVREKYGLDTGPVILFVGTLMPRKGVAELVQALGDVVPELETDPTVVIAGERTLDEDYTERVEELVRDHELGSNVSMPGFIPADELPALYTLADVFAVPSLEEGFGMTAIEAMAAGTPVVATRVGGLPQLVESGVHGQLVDPGDIDGLADALVDVLRSELPATRLRGRARDYSWPTVTARFRSVYEEVAE